MRLAHRLVLGSSAVVAMVMTIYSVTSMRQRQTLIGASLVRETETLAHTLQIVANSAIRNGQTVSLNRVLGRVVGNPEMAIAAVLDSSGAVLAGGPHDAAACVRPLVARTGRLAETRLWTDCGGRVRLVILPLERPAEALVIARRTTTMERDTAASQRSIVLTSLALALLGSLAILAVVRNWLTRPLGEILEGVRHLGGPTLPAPIRLRGAAAELQQLALAFNAMVERLQGNQRSLIRETEERIDLERRLRGAESFAAMGRLTGGVAHELGSPLGVIRVRAEAIQAAAGASPAIRRHADAIAGEVERIARLIRDLVHVARRHGLDPAPIELASVLDSVVEAIRNDAEAAGIELVRRVPPEPLTVAGDARLLHHAIYGIALNAVQAMRSHPGCRALTLAAERDADSARIVVEDTGPGIAPELMPRVFEPFFTTRDVGEGAGLGLAISAGIVEEHGGRLTLCPGDAGGVRAELELPLYRLSTRTSAA